MIQIRVANLTRQEWISEVYTTHEEELEPVRKYIDVRGGKEVLDGHVIGAYAVRIGNGPEAPNPFQVTVGMLYRRR